jgi:bacillithiol system protein YtxJ
MQKIHWNQLNNSTQLAEIKALSLTQKVLIFKHSTTCGVSAMALRAFESAWDNTEMAHITPYYLDLKVYRAISNQIAEDFAVQHESPQVLVIQGEKAIYHASHQDIDYEAIAEL